MVHETDGKGESLIPPQALPAGAEEFRERVRGLLDGSPKDEAMVEEAFAGLDGVFDRIAAGLYNLASMLVGEGEASARLVETAVATADVSACSNAAEARRSSRLALSRAAVETLEREQPGCLAAPTDAAPAGGCIEDDELEAAGVSRAELETMMAGPDRARVRAWLESLPTELRVVFVLRAVAGFKSEETAALLAGHGGPAAAGWTAEAVRETFRQGLCGLASQLLQATTQR
ncbi:MAG TPA: hypothetical protein VMV57_12195 [Terracidiphilus sp.]|nr:hypothetical protein [Terracidiphilus sp.]